MSTAEYITGCLVSGLLFGLAAGFAPGPLFALVLSETISHGRRAGIYVAVAPLVTDLPIIIGSLYIINRLSHMDAALGVLSLAGACFIAYMAYDCITSDIARAKNATGTPNSLGRGVLTNFLSPHPYIFWITVGGPIVIRASEVTLAAAAAYLAGFYGLLVGTKIFIAVVTDRSRRFVGGRAHGYILKALGAALVIFSIIFVRDGLRLLGFG